MTAIERFYDITISLNVHTINMKVFSHIDCAEKKYYTAKLTKAQIPPYFFAAS
jgi:hypothetical protein